MGAPLWPKSFGLLGKSVFFIRQGDWINKGHTKMAADTAPKTSAVRNFDLAANKGQTPTTLSLAVYCTTHQSLFGFTEFYVGEAFKSTTSCLAHFSCYRYLSWFCGSCETPSRSAASARRQHQTAEKDPWPVNNPRHTSA